MIYAKGRAMPMVFLGPRSYKQNKLLSRLKRVDLDCHRRDFLISYYYYWISQLFCLLLLSPIIRNIVIFLYVRALSYKKGNALDPICSVVVD